MKYSLPLLFALAACTSYELDPSKQVGELDGKPVYQEESKSNSLYPSDSLPSINSARQTETAIVRGYCGDASGRVIDRVVTSESSGYDPVLGSARVYYYDFKFVCNG